MSTWPPCWYTETLACSANAKTSTHAASSRSRQQAGLKVFSGEVKGGINTDDYTCEYRFGKQIAGSKPAYGRLLPISVQLAVARQDAKEQGESDDD